MKPVTSKGKQTTREIILRTLRSSVHSKVEDLADAASVSPVTVRHHLNALQADNLIEVSSVRRKVGRPYYVYGLNEQGRELFPQKYYSLTSRLLDELKEQLPPETVSKLLNGIVETILEEHRSKFETLSFEDRLSYVVTLLAEEGFLARWEKVGEEYRLTEFSCPYQALVDQHAELCMLDRELIVNVLQTPLTQHSCMLNGDNCCEFTFSANGQGA